MSIYLIIILLLITLAIMDLTIGVANDAVNFLNSAVGAKVAKYKTILIIAGIGVILGAVFSEGMMEVARKGIFNPQYFNFQEIIFIFVAVMIADVVILDIFNTLGLPTSTTVSIVFDLLGASVGIAFMHIYYSHDNSLPLQQYINSANALKIIFGILLSIFIAFFTGLLVQYISRLIFSFHYDKTIKYLGSLWGSIITTAIIYFLFLKGIKHASFVSEDFVTLISENLYFFLLINLVIWTTILQIFIWLFNINVMKFTVLLGTFALAMAFAGNDLVNFIGVPLAGINAYNDFVQNANGTGATSYLMTSLSGKVPINIWYLIFAGSVMIATLFFSRKAKSVIKTSVDLSRQSEGYERFGTSLTARVIVRFGNGINNIFKMITPQIVRIFIQKQFSTSKITSTKDGKAFDLVRASVNLLVASILISIATTYKLPLSTTYVTFMVAMGTSLADKAWGGDSAVYRVTGVFTVIGGWFLTAIIASLVAFTIAIIIALGKFVALFAFFAFAVYLIIRTTSIHRKMQAKKNLVEESVALKINDKESFLTLIHQIINVTFVNIKEILGIIINGFSQNNLIEIKKGVKIFNEVIKRSKHQLMDAVIHINDIKKENITNTYMELTLSFKQINNSLKHIIIPAYDHINNHHKSLSYGQINDLQELFTDFSNYMDKIIIDFKSDLLPKINVIEDMRNDILEKIKTTRKSHIKFMKHQNITTSTRANVLFFDIIYEMKILTFSTFDLYESFFEMKDALNKAE